MLNFCVAARVLISYASCFILNPRHGAFELATCARKGCKRVALHGVFCTSHNEGCVETGCRAAATSGTYYCQRHYVKPPPRKTVFYAGERRYLGVSGESRYLGMAYQVARHVEVGSSKRRKI